LLLCALALPTSARAWTWPVDGPVVRGFDFDRGHPYAAGQHRGVDISAARGAPVLAPAEGVVSFAGTVPSGGRTISIETPSGTTVTLLHLGSIGVKRGAHVDEGAVVGAVGASDDTDLPQPHVYLGIRKTADPQGYLDPLTLLPPRPATAPSPDPAPGVAAAVAVNPAPAVDPPAAAPAPAATSVSATTSAAESTPAPVDEPASTVGAMAAAHSNQADGAASATDAPSHSHAATSVRGRPATLAAARSTPRAGAAAATGPAPPAALPAKPRTEALTPAEQPNDAPMPTLEQLHRTIRASRKWPPPAVAPDRVVARPSAHSTQRFARLSWLPAPSSPCGGVDRVSRRRFV
jgi:hypothetical protein